MFEGIEFNQDQQGNPVDVLLELLDPKNIDVKTDVNINQIRVLCEVSYFNRRINSPENDPVTDFMGVLQEFKVLMVSNRRLSRKESIEGVKEIKPQIQAESLGNSLMPK